MNTASCLSRTHPNGSMIKRDVNYAPYEVTDSFHLFRCYDVAQHVGAAIERII